MPPCIAFHSGSGYLGLNGRRSLPKGVRSCATSTDKQSRQPDKHGAVSGVCASHMRVESSSRLVFGVVKCSCGLPRRAAPGHISPPRRRWTFAGSPSVHIHEHRSGAALASGRRRITWARRSEKPRTEGMCVPQRRSHSVRGYDRPMTGFEAVAMAGLGLELQPSGHVDQKKKPTPMEPCSPGESETREDLGACLCSV